MPLRAFKKQLLLLPLAIVLLQLFYALPLLCKLISFLFTSNHNPLWPFRPSGQYSLYRTVLFAVLSALLQVTIGFIGALALEKAVGRPSAWMSVLLIPALLGGASVGFVFRDIPGYATVLSNRSTYYTLGALVAVELWQYSPMCLYLFWLRLHALRLPIRDFSRISHLAPVEYVRYIAWPHCRYLAFVLALFAVLQAFGEYGKSTLMFRPSEATDTEMVSHWIESKHAQLLKNFSSDARDLTLGYSGLILLAGLMTALVLALLVLLLLGWFTVVAVGIVAPAAASLNHRWVLPCCSTALPLVALSPLAFLLRPFWNQPVWVVGRSFTRALLLTIESLLYVIPAAVLATAAAISFGLVLRLLMPRITEAFSSRSVPLLSLILLLHAIPSIGLAYCGHFWIQILPWPGWLFWIMAQAISAFAVVGVFTLYVHFDVPTNEVEFYRSANATFYEAAREGFFSRFRASYALILLFVLTTILNEDSINSVLATHFNSLIASLRSAEIKDYPMAAASIIIMVILAVLTVMVWNRLLPPSIGGMPKEVR